MTTRRDFIKKTVAGTAALSLGSILPGFGSSRYQDILGANEKIRIGVIGVNSRGKVAGTTGANQKVWHEKPISKAHGIIDTDLARDNLENDIPFADLQDL